MKKILTIMAIASILFACQPESRVFVDHQDLSPELEWLKKDVRIFELPLSDNNQTYNLSLSFRYASGYQYQTANVKVTETSPSGVVSIKEYELKVRESNGDYIGEPGLDIWDSEHLVESNKKYSETGIYTYTLEQNTSVDPLNFAMEIGVILDKAK
jgi:gliding motility-associated lipoprotein GldH